MKINLEVDNKRLAISTYLNLLQNFHKLSPKMMEILVELILVYLTYMERYDSQEVAEKFYLSRKHRMEVAEKLNVPYHVFNNYIWKFRKKGVLKENSIVSVLLPSFKDGSISLDVNIKLKTNGQAEQNEGRSTGEAG